MKRFRRNLLVAAPLVAGVLSLALALWSADRALTQAANQLLFTPTGKELIELTPPGSATLAYIPMAALRDGAQYVFTAPASARRTRHGSQSPQGIARQALVRTERGLTDMAETTRADRFNSKGDGKKEDGKKGADGKGGVHERHARERKETHARHQTARDSMNKQHEEERQALAQRQDEEAMAQAAAGAAAPAAPAAA
jgi:hypothetical protein